MNLTRYEDIAEVQFSDNICLAYKNYQPVAGCDALSQTKYLLKKLQEFLARLNEYSIISI